MLTRLDTRSKLLLTLAGLFITALLVGDIIGGKLFAAGATTLSVGIIPFPITFLLTDLLNEFYGKRTARVVTWVGFGMAVFAFTIITIAVLLPFSDVTRAADWKGITQPAFDTVFAGSQRILIASMVAYLFAQFADIWVFNKVKTATHGRFLWLRATGSTLVSQLIDTAVIQTLAWQGTLDASTLINLIASSYGVKVLVAVGLTPVIYMGHAVVERVLGIAPVKLDEHGEPLG
ncbi:MAG: queuosine precursor transporter [Archangium sp.]|nr:queuosine precursor transporter [Archangium sp.]